MQEERSAEHTEDMETYPPPSVRSVGKKSAC